MGRPAQIWDPFLRKLNLIPKIRESSPCIGEGFRSLVFVGHSGGKLSGSRCVRGAPRTLKCLAKTTSPSGALNFGARHTPKGRVPGSKMECASRCTVCRRLTPCHVRVVHRLAAPWSCCAAAAPRPAVSAAQESEVSEAFGQGVCVCALPGSHGPDSTYPFICKLICI